MSTNLQFDEMIKRVEMIKRAFRDEPTVVLQSPPALLSKASVARRLGISSAAISKALKLGRLSEREDGLIDLNDIRNVEFCKTDRYRDAISQIFDELKDGLPEVMDSAARLAEMAQRVYNDPFHEYHAIMPHAMLALADSINNLAAAVRGEDHEPTRANAVLDGKELF